MNIPAFLTVLFVSLISQASLHGNWTGWGVWKYQGEDPGMRCQSMNMTWTESEKVISIDQGKYDCDFFVMHLGKTEWRIQDGQLFNEAKKEVGTYDGTNFEVYMPAAEGETTSIHIKLKREANHIDFREVWYNEKEKIYVIEGRLFTGG